MSQFHKYAACRHDYATKPFPNDPCQSTNYFFTEESVSIEMYVSAIANVVHCIHKKNAWCKSYAEYGIILLLSHHRAQNVDHQRRCVKKKFVWTTISSCKRLNVLGFFFTIFEVESVLRFKLVQNSKTGFEIF